jgi:hypothetical protein
MPMREFLEPSPVPRRAAFCVSALLALLVFAAPLRAELKNRAVLGYDSFIDRYTILEADTFESIQELYGGLSNALSYRGGATKAGVNNFFRYGTQTIDELLDADGSVAAGASTSLNLRGMLHWKHFWEGSDYEFGNDFTQANAILRITRKVGGHSRLSVKSRFELMDYERKTDFDYDYRYYDGGLEWDTGVDFNSALRLGIFAGARDVPDSTSLSYDRFLAEIDARFSPASLLSFQLTAAADRKGYRETARSPYWSIMSYLEISRGETNGMLLSLRGESEILLFDRPDNVYFDTHFLRAGLRAKFQLRQMWTAYVEPRYATMLCLSFPEERYREISCVIGAEILRINGLWLNLSYEPGMRDYTLDENSLYSDFRLNRLSAMGSVPLPAESSLNLLVTHEPERHSRREDDFSVTLVSVDITKRF